MSAKRTTDHLEPSAKKRGSERQITKDDGDSQSDQEEVPGTFQRASDEVLKQRKIVRARRPAAAAPSASAAPSSTNPFAGVQLAPAGANPFAGIQLAAANITKPEEKPEEKKEQETSEKKDADTEEAQPPDALPKNPLFTGGFGSLATGSQATPALSLFGAAAAGSGGFGSLVTASSAPVFSFGEGTSASSAATTTPLFSFFGSSGAGASAQSDALAAANGDDHAGTNASSPAAPLPPETPVTTGEEDEETVFAGEGALYEFDESKKWRERGSGEMRLNVRAESKQARLIMRQRGNLRLLMNANLWRDMPVSKMEGGKGVTFAVVNAVVPEDKTGKDEEEQATTKQLATFALRIKNPDVLAGFLLALETHKQNQTDPAPDDQA